VEKGKSTNMVFGNPPPGKKKKKLDGTTRQKGFLYDTNSSLGIDYSESRSKKRGGEGTGKVSEKKKKDSAPRRRNGRDGRRDELQYRREESARRRVRGS